MEENSNLIKSSEKLPDNENDLRAMYSHLSSYMIAVVTYRFTTLGFFRTFTNYKPSEWGNRTNMLLFII